MSSIAVLLVTYLLRYRRISPQKAKHPTQKVIPLLKELIFEPDYNPKVILDPFIGVGSTAIACIGLNINFIGIELDEEYCKIAKERLRQEVL